MGYDGQQYREKEINLDVVVCTEVRRRKEESNGIRTGKSQ